MNVSFGSLLLISRYVRKFCLFLFLMRLSRCSGIGRAFCCTGFLSGFRFIFTLVSFIVVFSSNNFLNFLCICSRTLSDWMVLICGSDLRKDCFEIRYGDSVIGHVRSSVLFRLRYVITRRLVLIKKSGIS